MKGLARDIVDGFGWPAVTLFLGTGAIFVLAIVACVVQR